MCAIVTCTGSLSLLDMNWIVCTKLIIISVKQSHLGTFLPYYKKKGGDFCFFVEKQILVNIYIHVNSRQIQCIMFLKTIIHEWGSNEKS